MRPADPKHPRDHGSEGGRRSWWSSRRCAQVAPTPPECHTRPRKVARRTSALGCGRSLASPVRQQPLPPAPPSARGTRRRDGPSCLLIRYTHRLRWRTATANANQPARSGPYEAAQSASSCDIRTTIRTPAGLQPHAIETNPLSIWAPRGVAAGVSASIARNARATSVADRGTFNLGQRHGTWRTVVSDRCVALVPLIRYRSRCSRGSLVARLDF